MRMTPLSDYTFRLRVMGSNIKYSGIGIYEVLASGDVIVETIGVVESECALVGAWVIRPAEMGKLPAIIEGKLLLKLGEFSLPSPYDFQFMNNHVDLDAFLFEASSKGEETISRFNTEMDQRTPSKRTLIEPNLSNWLSGGNIDSSALLLKRMRKISSIQGTPPLMENVITASRLIQILITNWLNDETVRSKKSYLQSPLRVKNLLPSKWLEKAATLIS
jgi:hypothetical protein